MKVRLALVAGATLIFALLPAAAALAQPPGNDAFADATAVFELPFAGVVDVGEASVEEGEPLETCAPFANTVWYELTLEEATEVAVDSAGSDYDTAIAVWTGDSLEELSNVACVDDTFNSLQAAVTFLADSGETYHIQVGAFGEAFEGATLNLTIDEAARPTGRPEIFKSKFRGLSASAFVEEFDEENGVFSFTEVNVSESRDKVFQERPFRSAALFVSHFEESFDPDTGEITFVEIFGFTELMSDQFEVDRKLQSGFVMAELMLQGLSCTEGPHEPNGNGFEFETECTEIGPEIAAVDVVWDGTGPVFHSRFTDRFSTEGVRVSFTSTSTSRDAMVAGSVQGETIVFDLAGASGNLSRDSNSEMVVFRGGMFFF